MKKILLIVVLALTCVFQVSAQRTPVKHHGWAFMGLEGGASTNWYQFNEPYQRNGAGFGGYYAAFHVEFLMGNRQQHGICLDEGVEWLKGKSKAPLMYDGTVENKVTNLYVKLGYKYTFRNTFFVEVFPQLDIPLNPTVVGPTTEHVSYTPSTTEKTKLGFAIGVSAGRNITDNFAIVFRLKKSFTDYFNYDAYGNYMLPGATKGAIIFQMGMVLGFNM